MGIPAIILIALAALIPALFFVYIGMRAFRYRRYTKNETELESLEPQKHQTPVDVGAQKR